MPTAEAAPRAERSVGTGAKELLRRAKVHDIRDGAASVTYWVMLSLAPMLLALTSMLGFLEVFAGKSTADDIRDEVVEFIERNLGQTDSTAEITDTIVDVLERSRGGTAIIGFLIAAWGAKNGFAALFRALANVAEREPRRGVKAIAINIGLALATLVITVAAILQLGVGPLFGFESQIESDAVDGFIDVWSYLRWPVVAAILVMWLAVLIAYGTRQRWRHSLWSAGCTTVFWLVAVAGFRIYLSVSGGGNPILGVLAGIVVALTVVWLLALGVLVGAELGEVLAWRRATSPIAETPAATPATEPSPAASASAIALLAGAVFASRRKP